MFLDKTIHSEIRDIILKCVDDVEQDIINKIKDKHNTSRYTLISDLDTITALRDKVLARFSYYNPIERTD